MSPLCSTPHHTTSVVRRSRDPVFSWCLTSRDAAGLNSAGGSGGGARVPGSDGRARVPTAPVNRAAVAAGRGRRSRRRRGRRRVTRRGSGDPKLPRERRRLIQIQTIYCSMIADRPVRRICDRSINLQLRNNIGCPRKRSTETKKHCSGTGTV